MPVRQRGKDSYQVDVTHEGKRFRESFNGTKSNADIISAVVLDCMKHNKDIKSELQKLNPLKYSVLSLQDLLRKTTDRYWYNTDVKQLYNANNVVDLIVKNTDVNNIDETTIDDLVNILKDQGNSNGTINRKLASLSKMLTFAHKRKYIPAKPVIEWLKEGKGRTRFFSLDEENKILDILFNAEFFYFLDFVIVLIDTGLRKTELLNACKTDIVNGNLSVYETKNEKPRTIPLTKRVQEIFLRYTTKYPFANLKDSDIRFQWNYVREKMGLLKDKQFVLHACRHTCASRLVQRGISLQVVKEWLGHKNINQTLTYAHLAPKNLQDAVKVLEADYDINA